MLIYRGETRFDLKGAIPVKLPLILNGQEQISCQVTCKSAKPTWRISGELEQFAFLPEAGMITLQKIQLPFNQNQLVNLDRKPQSFLRFTPVKWLTYRTNISISVINKMPLSLSGSSSIALVPSTTVLNIPLIIAAITSTVLLPANVNRIGFSITNTTAKTLYVDYDGAASTADYAVAIPAGGYFEPPINYTGAVHGVWSAVDAGKGALVREFI
jgi:hypothetical protein